jgi:hypothetical protein
MQSVVKDFRDLLHVSAHEKESGFDRAKRGKDFLNCIDITKRPFPPKWEH